MPKVLCIFHAACADGLGAAWAVHRALGDGVEFVAAKYGDDPFSMKVDCTTCQGSGGHYGNPCTDCLGTGYKQGGALYQFTGRDILIVDFSYPLATLRAIAAEARSVLVLDHHKSAQEDLATLPIPYSFNPLKPQSAKEIAPYKVYRAGVDIGIVGSDSPELAAIFDLNRSGCGIAWDYLHTEGPKKDSGYLCLTRPHIIDLIEDRDLWRFKFGDESRAFRAVLQSYDWTDLPGMFKQLDSWADIINDWSLIPGTIDKKRHWRNLIDEGQAILRADRQRVASTVAATRRTIPIAGHTVPCANVPPWMASEAGHLMCEGLHSTVGYDLTNGDHSHKLSAPFAATYSDGADGRRHFSLRSPEGGADCGQIAKRMAEYFNHHHSDKLTNPLWSGGGHLHAAGFDAPLGWEGE
jgi:uncharacterized protein